eukprot:GHVU01179341.1.p1 GENE.GHVU01179341.1~~GHVU01179341.1.p1  ORF type:complete len:175 (+),score=9.72 GHVU01179341.1:131-655(+)
MTEWSVSLTSSSILSAAAAAADHRIWCLHLLENTSRHTSVDEGNLVSVEVISFGCRVSYYESTIGLKSAKRQEERKKDILLRVYVFLVFWYLIRLVSFADMSTTLLLSHRVYTGGFRGNVRRQGEAAQFLVRVDARKRSRACTRRALRNLRRATQLRPSVGWLVDLLSWLCSLT